MMMEYFRNCVKKELDEMDYTYDELSSFNYGYDFKDLDGNYPYQNLSDDEYNEIKDLLAPATMEGIFQKWGDSILYCIEIKDDGDLGKQAADELLRLIEKYDVKAVVCVASFHKEIADYCAEVGIDFSTSPYNKEAVDLCVELNVPFIKIGSGEITWLEQLEYIASKGIPVMLATGDVLEIRYKKDI